MNGFILVCCHETQPRGAAMARMEDIWVHANYSDDMDCHRPKL